MSDSVLDSTPAQFAEMFQKEPMALVRVLREFWVDVEKTVRIEDYQRGAMVDFYFDDDDCRYRFSALEGRLSRIKDGMDTAARYCMAIGRLGKVHAQSITEQIRILSILPSPGGNHVSTALWFPDTIDLIEFEVKQVEKNRSAHAPTAVYSAGHYAKEFAKNPAAITAVLRHFWDRLRSQVDAAEYDVHWEFHIDDPSKLDRLFMEFHRISDAIATAAVKNEVVERVQEMFGPKLQRFDGVLGELMADCRSQTHDSFPELCDSIEVVTDVKRTELPERPRELPTGKSRPRKSTKKPEAFSDRWMRWILANWAKKMMKDSSTAAVIEYLIGTGTRKNSTISDYLNRKIWAAPTDNDYQRTSDRHGRLDALEYSDFIK